ncbi:hypothetical protein [Streptomyces sp. DSM 40750]|uniref:hypothetical protein n=1 Tax=Streptomyces sp. DSM 40750 TaxID=2801030 RepID=UPI00214BE32A|nr:hypothetical protein [Streptomyces sp. DSM 40750]UUU25242.1 hypothetical protein JIX55_36095 [Streptomyces sp. DSM 40750]
MTAVMARRRIFGRRADDHRRGTRNRFVVHGRLKMIAGNGNALADGEVTHRGVGRDGVRIQQPEEEEAQAKQTPQSRC